MQLNATPSKARFEISEFRQLQAKPTIAVSSPHQNIRILRLPQVCSITGFSRSMIYQMEADQRFPRRVKIGARAVGWLEGEVRAWLQARIDLRRV